MASSIFILILAGLALWGLWYLFVKSVVWVFEPVIQYFKPEEEIDSCTENDMPEEEEEEDERKLSIKISTIQADGTHKEDEMKFDLPKR